MSDAIYVRVRLSGEAREWVENESRDTCCSKAFAIRQLIKRELRYERGLEQRIERLERALEEVKQS